MGEPDEAKQIHSTRVISPSSFICISLYRIITIEIKYEVHHTEHMHPYMCVTVSWLLTQCRRAVQRFNSNYSRLFCSPPPLARLNQHCRLHHRWFHIQLRSLCKYKVMLIKCFSLRRLSDPASHHSLVTLVRIHMLSFLFTLQETSE